MACQCGRDYSMHGRGGETCCWRCFRSGRVDLGLLHADEDVPARIGTETVVRLVAVSDETGNHGIRELLRRAGY